MKRSLIAIAMFALTLSGCGPYKTELFEEIGPNETAFVIPLEGDTKDAQAQLQSVEYLEKNKVAAKRVIIPQREKSLGRMWWDYQWIPTARVIKVDRTPITREWTQEPNTGTSVMDDSIGVESLDSINFSAGVNVTCSVEEADAAKFLYYFAGKKLSDVVDSNVRGFIQTVLAREFGKYKLTECPQKKAEVFDIALKEAKATFEAKGVTVEYLGSSEGLAYDDPKIQEAINKKFTNENDIEVAKQEKLAQDERNILLKEKAKAEAEAAAEYAKSAEAMTLKVELEVKRIQAEAMKTAAERWLGNVPASVLPQGSNMLFGLDAPQKK